LNPAPPAHSLRRQLGIAVLVVLTVLGSAVAIGANILFDRIQARVIEADVAASTERLLAAIRMAGSGPFLDQARLDPAYNRPLSGHYFIISFADRQWRSRSLWDTEIAVSTSDPPGRYRSMPGPDGQQLLLLSRDFTRFGQRFTITVASDYSHLVAEFHRGLALFTALWLLALGMTLITLNSWMARALQPVSRARSQVAEIQAGERQALDEDVPLELLPLIRQINALLEETRHALSRSRYALGNLGHALKPPLAVLFTLVEREQLRQLPELHQSLRTQLDQIDQRISRELSQSQGPSASGVQQSFAPDRDLPPLVDALERAHRRRLAVELRHAAGLMLPFERADMLEVLGNLLDNAWKWAGSRVLVTIDEAPAEWRLRVADDGPGIDVPDDREQALARGYRLDESVAGQGLGLAIAADIVATYRGSLRLDHSPLGGLEVYVQLPKPQGRNY